MEMWGNHDKNRTSFLTAPPNNEPPPITTNPNNPKKPPTLQNQQAITPRFKAQRLVRTNPAPKPMSPAAVSRSAHAPRTPALKNKEPWDSSWVAEPETTRTHNATEANMIPKVTQRTPRAQGIFGFADDGWESDKWDLGSGVWKNRAG